MRLPLLSYTPLFEFQLLAELFQLFGLFCQLFEELFQLFGLFCQLLGELFQLLLACAKHAPEQIAVKKNTK